MKFDKRKAAPDDDFRSGASVGITAASYRDRAVAFIKGRNGEGFVIRAIEGTHGSSATRELPTEAQWIAWERWFDQKKVAFVAARYRGMTTVPCEWPEDFDAEASYSDKSARLPPIKITPESVNRAAVVERESARAAKQGVFWGKRRKDFVAPKEPELDPYRFVNKPCAPLSGWKAREEVA